MKLPGKIESSLRSAMDQVPDATGYLIAYSGDWTHGIAAPQCPYFTAWRKNLCERYMSITG